MKKIAVIATLMVLLIGIVAAQQPDTSFNAKWIIRGALDGPGTVGIIGWGASNYFVICGQSWQFVSDPSYSSGNDCEGFLDSRFSLVGRPPSGGNWVVIATWTMREWMPHLCSLGSDKAAVELGLIHAPWCP